MSSPDHLTFRSWTFVKNHISNLTKKECARDKLDHDKKCDSLEPAGLLGSIRREISSSGGGESVESMVHVLYSPFLAEFCSGPCQCNRPKGIIRPNADIVQQYIIPSQVVR